MIRPWRRANRTLEAQFSGRTRSCLALSNGELGGSREQAHGVMGEQHIILVGSVSCLFVAFLHGSSLQLSCGFKSIVRTKPMRRANSWSRTTQANGDEYRPALQMWRLLPRAVGRL